MITTIQQESGKTQSIPLAVSQTITKGMMLTWTGGYLVEAVADEEVVDYVALEAVTTDGSSHTEILCVPASQSRIRFEADTSANTAVAQRGVAYETSTNLLIDNETSASANGFMVDELVGAAANKKVRGFFL